MKLYTEKESAHRFLQMGLVFVGLAVFFGGGAYVFPTEAPSGFYEWIYLSADEKEAFYMVSLIFVVASMYCLKKGIITSDSRWNFYH